MKVLIQRLLFIAFGITYRVLKNESIYVVADYIMETLFAVET